MVIKFDEVIKNLTIYKVLFSVFIVNLSLGPIPAWASDKIIKQEPMSFEQCLKVIDVSVDKLSVTPQISDVSANNRVAIFTLFDGTLKIICNGEIEVITVSTKAN